MMHKNKEHMRMDEDELPLQTIDFSFNLMFASFLFEEKSIKLFTILHLHLYLNPFLFKTNSFQLNNNKLLSTFNSNLQNLLNLLINIPWILFFIKCNFLLIVLSKKPFRMFLITLCYVIIINIR